MDESSNREVQKASAETPNQSRVPDTSGYEGILAGIKLAVQAIPLVGGTIAETVGYIGQQYVDRQMRAFWEGLVRDLEEFKVRLDHLNDSFFTTALYAAQVARITHEAETHEQLRNAALNAAMPGAPSDDLQRIFVNMVANLTPSPLAGSAAGASENAGYCAREACERGRVCVWCASHEPVTKLSRVRPAEMTVAPPLVGGGEHAEEPCRSLAPLTGLPFLSAMSSRGARGACHASRLCALLRVGCAPEDSRGMRPIDRGGREHA
jgi:hypothetical protein